MESHSKESEEVELAMICSVVVVERRMAWLGGRHQKMEHGVERSMFDRVALDEDVAECGEANDVKSTSLAGIVMILSLL